jgi:apolipoprotein D and lipocalin family protein
MIHLPRAARPSIGWRVCLLVSLFWLNACSMALPEGASAVTPFDINRYQGKWYEIARLDHSFERGLGDVTANYRLLPDGSMEVVNRGYDGNRNEWRQVTGHALLIGEANRASLKVSFFGPFYAGYHVIALDQQH